MKKSQKNVQLPDEVNEWLRYMEKITGASQSRLVLAALAQYALSDEATRSLWMQMSGLIAVEGISFEDLPHFVFEKEIESWENVIEYFEKRNLDKNADAYRSATKYLELAKFKHEKLKQLRTHRDERRK